MSSQIYLKIDTIYYTIPAPVSVKIHEVYLGAKEKWDVLNDENKEWQSLGGSQENPLIYKISETGITNFVINLFTKTNIIGEFTIQLEGNKKYYIDGSYSSKTTCFVIPYLGTKDELVKFKWFIKIAFATEYEGIYTLFGSQDPIKSTITTYFVG